MLSVAYDIQHVIHATTAAIVVEKVVIILTLFKSFHLLNTRDIFLQKLGRKRIFSDISSLCVSSHSVSSAVELINDLLVY